TVGSPVVALLDGLPLLQHVALRDRLMLDDPDDFQRNYRPEQQQHGTAMASLILHGDLNRPEPPLQSSLYVRPIYLPQTDLHGRSVELTPTNRLLVDLLHRAIRRMVAGDGGGPGAP